MFSKTGPPATVLVSSLVSTPWVEEFNKQGWDDKVPAEGPAQVLRENFNNTVVTGNVSFYVYKICVYLAVYLKGGNWTLKGNIE